MNRRLTVWLDPLARLALAAVFAAAAVPKLLEPSTLAADIENYRLVPTEWSGKLAMILPVTELVLACALLFGPLKRGAALLGTLLLLAFTAAMVQARLRGIDLSCGCFGAALEAKVSWLTVVRTFVLAGLGAYVFVRASRAEQRDEGQGPAVTPRAGDAASS